MTDMIKFTTILFILIIPIGNNLFGQDFENKEIRDFLISTGEIQEGDRCSYYAYELIKSDELKCSDICGIYRIGAYASHSYTYLLLLDKRGKTFLDCHTDLYQTLKSIFSFFEKNNHCFTDLEKLSYIKEAMEIYHRNNTAIPW
jgi:effector-binding domain-containing protein|nr:hypothetical protein [Bacteroides intestinalis]